jgi:hypothetical protein
MIIKKVPMHKMKKREREEMVSKIIVVGERAKTAFEGDLGPDTIDFMVEAALEKLDMEPKKQKKIYQKG